MSGARRLHAERRDRLVSAVIEWLEQRRLLASTFVSIPSIRDIVFDDVHNMLYATTSTTVARYNATTKALLSPWAVGGTLNGLDITPDASFIYIADAFVSGQAVIRKINLSNGAVTNLNFGTNGFTDIAISSNGLGFAAGGSSPTALRQIDLATDTVSNRADFAFNTSLINRSANRSTLFFQEFSSTRMVSLYHASSNDFIHAGSAVVGLATPAAVNRNGTLIAMLRGGASLINDSMGSLRTLPGIDGGIIFDPNRDVLYGVNAATNEVIAFDTNTWGEKYRIALSGDVLIARSIADGQMAINAAGTQLYLTTFNGIHVVDIPQPTGNVARVAIDPIPALQRAGATNTFAVRILDAAGDPAINYRGSISFNSNFADSLPATYTFTAADAGVHTFNVTFNNSPGTHTITVRETRIGGQVLTLNSVIHNGTVTSLAITNAREMILDGPRGMLYFSTSAGTIERYNLSTQSMLLPISAGTTLNGFDVTPDGSFIYAAEGIAGATQGLIRKINITSGVVTNVPYTYASDGPAWDVAATVNGLAFFTTTALTGLVPFRQIDLATDAITLRSDLQVGQGAILDRSFNHGSLLLQSTSGSSPVAAYNSSTDAWTLSTSNSTTTRISGALSRDGTLAATHIGGQTRITSTASGMPWIKYLSAIDGGIVFDPQRDVFYGVNSATDEIIAYNTSTWLEKYRIPVGQNVSSSVAMGAGQLAINDEATLLFLSTATGIRVYNIPQPTGIATKLLVSDFPKFVKKGITRQVTIRALDPAGNPVLSYSGTIHFSSDDPAAALPADYTFTPADQGVHTFDFSFNTTGTRSITVTDAASSLTGTQNAITIHAGSPAVVPILGQEVAFDPNRRILYRSSTSGFIERYELDTESLLPPIFVGSPLRGIDITPDGGFLYVADMERTATHGRIRRVNTTTSEVTDLLFTPVSSTEVAYDLAIAGNGLAFFTSVVPSGVSGPLRQIDLATGTISIRADLPGSYSASQLSRSSDRGTLVLQRFFETHAIARYDAASDTWRKHPGTSFPNSNFIAPALSRDGSLLASPIDILSIIDSGFTTIRKLNRDNLSGGFSFDPNLDVLYAVDSSLDQLVAFNTNTWAEKYRVNIAEDVSLGQPFGIGQLAISGDGKKAFLTVGSGARVINIPQSNKEAAKIVSDFPRFVKQGVQRSFTVMMLDAAGEIATNYRGTIRFTSNDPQAILPANYIFTAADSGSHTFNATFDTAGSRTLTITDTANATITGTQSGITIHSGDSLVPISTRRDLVADPVRRLLYFTTNTGTVERYDPLTQSLLSSINIGTPLNAADITPDGKYLLVADSFYNSPHGYLHKIDLDTLAVTDFPFDRAPNEGGAWDLAIDFTGKVIFSTDAIAAGLLPLRQLDMATGAVTTLQMVHPHTHISRGEPRGRILLSDTFDNSGLVYTYDAATGTIGPSRNLGASNLNSLSSINRDGAFIATELNGTTILNASDLSTITNFPTLDGGVIFDSTKDQLFGVNSTTNTLYCYNTSDWSILWQIPTGEVPTSTPLDSGEMALGGDGRFLLLSLSSSIQTLKVDPTPSISFPLEIHMGSADSFTITMRDPAGNIDTRYRGSVHFSSDDPAAVLPPDYTFTAADAGVHTFEATLNTMGRHSLTVTDSVGPDSITQSNILVYGVALNEGVLTVSGSNAADNLQIRGYFDQLKVVLNGVDRLFDPDAISSLNIQMLEGADLLDLEYLHRDNGVYQLFGGTVDLGGGDDRFSVGVGTLATPLTVLGGDGADYYTQFDNLNSSFDGGAGSDTFHVYSLSTTQTISLSSTTMDIPDRHVTYSNTELVSFSGAGSYTINLNAPTGPQFEFITGDGDDVFNLLAGWSVSIHSGGGNDTLFVGAHFDGGVSYDYIFGSAGTDRATIQGTDADDFIRVKHGTDETEQQIILWIQDTPTSSHGRSAVSATGLDSIYVDTGLGNDIFLVESTASAGVITLAGSQGNERFSVYSQSVPLTALGGAGNDVFNVMAGTWTAAYDGGDGNDSVAFYDTNTDLINMSTTSISDPTRSVSFVNNEGITLLGTSGNDVFNISSTPLPLTLITSGGRDTFNLATAGNLDALDKNITISDNTGGSTLNFNDQLNSDPEVFTVTSNTLTRAAMGLVTFAFVETLSLRAGSGNDQINIVSLPQFRNVNIDSGDGNDTISANGPLSSTRVTLAGGNGDDTMNFAASSFVSFKFAGGGGDDTLNVNGGTFTLAEDANLTSDNLSVSVANGATLLMNASQHLAAMRISQGGRATLSSNGSRVLVLKDLDIQGKLDLANNDLIVNATAGTRLDVLAAVAASIRSAYGAVPHWQGNGIASSTAAANPGRGLGAILNSGPGSYEMFDGQNVDENSILVAFTLVGDLNLDKLVTISDFIDLSSNFGQPGDWRQGDVNYDQTITIADFIALAANFSQALAGTAVAMLPQSAASQDVQPTETLRAVAPVDETDVLILKQKNRRLDFEQSAPRRQAHHRRHHPVKVLK